MKPLLSTLLLSISYLLATAQAPEVFNYQGIARDNSGNILADQLISLQLSILDNSANVEYAEVWSVTTNNLGLFDVRLGDGFTTAGWFSGIDWSTGSYHLKVELDPIGGTNYQEMGTSQLLSVPYALYAAGSPADNPPYSVGDFAQGGVIFWVDERGEHGLVCAKEDLGPGYWYNGGSYARTLATGDGIYAGEMNTSIIVAVK